MFLFLSITFTNSIWTWFSITTNWIICIYFFFVNIFYYSSAC